jgi:hypothetical protein
MAFGRNSQWTPKNILLRDNLSGMGDYITDEVGSLNWIICNTNAQMDASAFNLVQLLSEQVNASTSSVYLPEWAQVYNLQGLSSTQAILEQIQLIQSITGTPPTLANVRSFLQAFLGQIFIDVQWAPENQQNATIDPITDLFIDNLPYEQPLANLLVYVWQPRDNQDNLLMPTPVFNSLLETYRPILQNWLPAFTQIETMNLVNLGNQQGYNFPSYIITFAGQTAVVGNNTTFTQDFFPQSGSTSVPFSINRNPPIQVVDANNVLQTYYVASVVNDGALHLTAPAVSNTNGFTTYRTLGFVTDTPGMVDGGSLFNN